MNKLGLIKWFIESLYRLTKKSPSFFVYLAWFGAGLALIAFVLYILDWFHLGLPGILSWLNNGFFVGFGSGITFVSSLTVDKTKVSDTVLEKKMPVTANHNQV